MGLFGPAWKSKNIEKALQAVNGIADQSLLAEIAIDDTVLFGVQKAAFDKITDQSLFVKIAADDAGSIQIKRAAIANITNEQAIKDILSASANRTSLLDSIRNADLRNWATVFYLYNKEPQNGTDMQTVRDLFLQISREDLLVELVDKMSSLFSYLDTQRIGLLMQKKSNMPKFKEAMMKKWFDKNCNLKNDCCGNYFVGCLSSNAFQDIPWSAYCPAGFPDIIIKHGKYQTGCDHTEGGRTIRIPETAEAEIAYVLETLYGERKDFREQIMTLNGYLLFSGSEEEFVGGTGDHETGFYVYSSQPQKLQIEALSPDSIKVCIETIGG